MGRLIVKICGVTTLDDALYAVEQGADAVGFNFYRQSKRYISPDQAAKIVDLLPAGLMRIGVFVDPEREFVNAVLQNNKLSALQFSGNEAPEALSGYHLPVIKAIHVANTESIVEMNSYHVDSFLLDTYRSENFGGTGTIFDWNLAVEAKRFGKVMLAGGLTPENVADAVRKVKPYGVDVSSGVEISHGIKDHKKVKEFILRAREANRTE
ncbi:MAG: phosphoribosylanthranilate isomerase [Bacteroidota bacterium]